MPDSRSLVAGMLNNTRRLWSRMACYLSELTPPSTLQMWRPSVKPSSKNPLPPPAVYPPAPPAVYPPALPAAFAHADEARLHSVMLAPCCAFKSNAGVLSLEVNVLQSQPCLGFRVLANLVWTACCHYQTKLRSIHNASVGQPAVVKHDTVSVL